MREIIEHMVNPANEKLRISVLDEPGAGGANHLYRISGFDASTNQSDPYPGRQGHCMSILFQNGPIPEKGVNGITQEVLLAIIADRLRSFQAGPYACSENAIALGHIEAAQNALHLRTRTREARGVEGTHTV